MNSILKVLLVFIFFSKLISAAFSGIVETDVINQGEIIFNFKSMIYSDSPDHINLVKAIRKGDLHTVALLSQKNKKLINHYSEGLGAPLCTAVMANKPEIVRYLVENGASINNSFFMGARPLDIALIKKCDKIVDYLLKNGANPNLKSELFSGRSYPLQLAVDRFNLHCVASLLNHGADINIKREKSCRIIPIYSAMSDIEQNYKSPDIIIYLLIRGARFDMKENCGMVVLGDFLRAHERMGFVNSMRMWGKSIYRIVFCYKFFLDV